MQTSNAQVNIRPKGNPTWQKGKSGNPSGRTPGSQNHITKDIQKAIHNTFHNLQGHEGKDLTSWALENTTAFYTILYPKIIPKNIELSGDAAFPILMAALLNELACRYDNDPALKVEYQELDQIEHQVGGEDGEP